MANYDSTKLIVQMKALARSENLPLDSTELWDSLSEAQTYIKAANAYAGQTIKAKLEDNKYHTYTIQPSDGGFILEEIGASSSTNVKQYVKVVSTLPSSDQEEGVLYINTTDSTGSIWTGSAWKEVFRDVQARVTALESKVTTLEETVNEKAPLNNPVFTGTVTLASDPTTNLEAATKQYVDRLIGNLTSSAPGVVTVEEGLPQTGYKAGQTWRVAEAGTYAGQVCETGDLIICVADYSDSFDNADFIVVQANIDGAVTGGDSSTDGNIVIYDGTTGKVIKDSNVSIASLNTAISNSHTHSNKAALDTYDKTQTELLEAAQDQVDAAVGTLSAEIEGKADKATTLEGYGITDAYTTTDIDGKLATINQNLNTKLDSAAVDEKIATAKTDILEDASDSVDAKIGDLGESSTIVEFVNKAVGSGGSDIAGQIDAAIAQAKAYTDTALTITEF